jgi:short-subunit dehydrogenase
MSPKICWITGASSGIGAELASQLRDLGYIVAASARSVEKLKALEAAPHTTGKIVPYPLDVTDRTAVKSTINEIFAKHGGIDLAILCAGTYIADSAETFDAVPIGEQLRLNVMGVAHALESLLPPLSKRPGAQIAIVSSVAGYRGLPYAAGYGASKAALINMAESLKPQCNRLGIKLQLICPGFVKTALTDKNDFPMPFLISVEQAAKDIIKGLSSRRFEIVFPWRMKLTMKLLRLLPYSLFFALTRKMLRR